MSWQQLGLLFGFLLKGIYGPSCCLVAKLCSTILANCLDCSLPGSSVIGISQQECLRGLPFPPPGNLPDPGGKPASPALQADPLPLNHLGRPYEPKGRLRYTWPCKGYEKKSGNGKIKIFRDYRDSQSESFHCHKEFSLGTSLVVQWLRLCAPNAGGLGSIPGQGTKFHMLQLRVHMPQPRLGTAK